MPELLEGPSTRLGRRSTGVALFYATGRTPFRDSAPAPARGRSDGGDPGEPVATSPSRRGTGAVRRSSVPVGAFSLLLSVLRDRFMRLLEPGEALRVTVRRSENIRRRSHGVEAGRWS